MKLLTVYNTENLCIVGPDPKYNTDRTFAEEFDERLRVHYMYLKSILSTHPELKWTQTPSHLFMFRSRF